MDRVDHLDRIAGQEIVVRIGAVAGPFAIIGQYGRIIAHGSLERIAILVAIKEAAVFGCQIELAVARRGLTSISIVNLAIAALIDVDRERVHPHRLVLTDIVDMRPVSQPSHVVGTMAAGTGVHGV